MSTVDLRWVVVGMPTAGVGTVVIQALSGGSDRLTRLSMGLLFALAAFVAAGLLGFLFGIPKRLQSDQAGTTGRSVTYVPNTNLEQISDWLTKLLLGATLAQAGAIGAFSERRFAAMGEALGGGTGTTEFAGGLVIYFGVCGFLVGWLATRLLLGRALAEADALNGEVREVLVERAEEERAVGNEERAGRLEAMAATIAAPAASASARQYEGLRASAPSGRARTSLLEEVVRFERERAQELGEELTRTGVAATFKQGKEGDRIVAIAQMQARPDLVDFELLADAIERPRSAFEQWHALLTVLRAVEATPADQGTASRIRRAIAVARTGELTLGSDRATLCRRIEDALGR